MYQINKLISDGSVITGVVKGANGITITLSNGNFMKLPMAQMVQMLQYGASERMAIGIKMT